jgi:hypothetical protein
MTKKELLQSPERVWNDTTRLYDEILLIPKGKHMSGWMQIVIIGGYMEEGVKKYEICGYPDVISTFFPITQVSPDIQYSTVRMDCYYPSGILRYHTGSNKFHVSEALSDMEIKLIKS